jgi:hypothetical protein
MVSGAYRILANIIFVKRTNKDTFTKNKTITQVIWKQKNKNWKKLYSVLVANAFTYIDLLYNNEIIFLNYAAI